MNDLRVWIEELIERRYGTASKLADAVGMSVSAFSRSTKMGTLSTENLLRLAIETGEPAGLVFARAGKSEINALIEQLYGRPLTVTERDRRRALTLFDQLSDAARVALLDVMEEFPKAREQATDGSEDFARRGRRR